VRIILKLNNTHKYKQFVRKNKRLNNTTEQTSTQKANRQNTQTAKKEGSFKIGCQAKNMKSPKNWPTASQPLDKKGDHSVMQENSLMHKCKNNTVQRKQLPKRQYHPTEHTRKIIDHLSYTPPTWQTIPQSVIK
jgi:hypothetical protein